MANQTVAHRRVKLCPLAKFGGTAKEDAKSWLTRFNTCSKIDNWSDSDKCLIFSIYVDDVCSQWHQILDSRVQNDWPVLEKAFIDRFIKGIPRWLGEQNFANRKQNKGESIDSYISDLRRMCSQLDKSDSDLLTQFLLGLQPATKRYVIGQNPTDIQQAENAARMAESIDVLLTGDKDHASMALYDVNAPVRNEIATITEKLDSKLQRGESQLKGMRPPKQSDGKCYICGGTDDLHNCCLSPAINGSSGAGKPYGSGSGLNQRGLQSPLFKLE